MYNAVQDAVDRPREKKPGKGDVLREEIEIQYGSEQSRTEVLPTFLSQHPLNNFKRNVNEFEDDPAIDSFLSFLAEDIKRRPEALTALSPALAERIAALTEGVKVDLDAPIDGDVDL